MDEIVARRLVALAREAYTYVPGVTFPSWRPRHVDPFVTPNFTGFAASDERAAYLVFRGTKLHLDSQDSYLRTLRAWLTNLDYAQAEEGGGRVHRGYARELAGMADG